MSDYEPDFVYLRHSRSEPGIVSGMFVNDMFVIQVHDECFRRPTKMYAHYLSRKMKRLMEKHLAWLKNSIPLDLAAEPMLMRTWTHKVEFSTETIRKGL